MAKNTYHYGHFAENIAKAVLVLKGYRILASRYRNAAGEIDIVARRRKVVVFVEVKARRNYSQLEAAITPKQLDRIRRAASIFLAKYPQHDARFDVVFVSPFRWPLHLKDAWC